MRKLVILLISTILIILVGCMPKATTTNSPKTTDIAGNMEEAMVQEIPNEGSASGDISVEDYIIEEPYSRALDVPHGDVAVDIIIGSGEATLNDYSSVEPAEPFIVVQEPDNRVFDVHPGNVGEPDNQSISRYSIAIIIGASVIALIVIGFVVLFKRKRSVV